MSRPSATHESAIVDGIARRAQRFGHTAWWVVFQHHPSHDVTCITQVHPPRSRKDAPTEPRLAVKRR